MREVALGTPWNQIEAGMAFALEIPVLVVSDRLSDSGVFAMRDDTSSLVSIDIAEGGVRDLDEAVSGWLRTLSSF